VSGRRLSKSRVIRFPLSFFNEKIPFEKVCFHFEAKGKKREKNITSTNGDDDEVQAGGMSATIHEEENDFAVSLLFEYK
jgi:hypothetical protein